MEIKLLSCPLCLKPHFPGVDSLRSSLISVATSHLTCPVCNESLLGLDKLTIHLFSHISDTANVPKHNEETTRVVTENEINESINSLDKPSMESDDSRIKCDICSFSFTDKTILDIHQKLLHQTLPDQTTGLYSYHCHLCSKKFKKRGSLMVHLRVAHHGFGHQIDVKCSKEGSTTDVIKDVGAAPQRSPSEQTKVHDNKQWECDVCSKMFTTKYFLKKHKRLHTGEMPYFCAQCNKSFTFQQSYHKHMLYHSSEKPYVCSECGRAFKELSTLQNHARIHSGERPFKCETCGKRFRQRVSYLVHQRIHTGIMPYKCTACEKSFRYKVSQRSHKCPMNPPGTVIRITEQTSVGKQEGVITTNEETTKLKCIMSVDYNTGSINFIQNDQNKEINAVFVKNTDADQDSSRNKKIEAVDAGITANSQENGESTSMCGMEPPDFFSMVLSPLLPDVESLCLTSSTTEDKEQLPEKPCEAFHLINEEALKDLLYDLKN